MWARIDGDRVAEITDINPVGRFHPSIKWVPCDSETQVGWELRDGVFSAPKFAPEPTPVLSQVTRAQGKAALITAGLWQNALDYVTNITDPTKKALADVALNDTSHWRRDSPFLGEVAQELGLSKEQLDDLFSEASKIQL